jgi:hypothetical protein
MTVGVGDTILRAEGRESMPNAFGRADIFGRTRSTGLVVVQYGGMRLGKAVLLRTGVATQSDATTMTSTGLFIPTQQRTVVSGTVGNEPITGTSTTTGVAYIPPRAATVTSVQQPTIPIEVDWRKNSRVPIAGYTVVIEAADANSITFHIE